MRPHVCLILALAALHARAASIPAPAETSFEKKLTEAVKEVLEKDAELQNVSSEEELIDQAHVVKDIDNKLLKKVAVDGIPVKVIVEEVKPTLKASEDKKNCDKEDVDIDSDSDIKRVEIDLKHPGEPQRQEHETQNPEHNENEHDAVANIKQMIKNTQAVFNDGFRDVSNGINDWLHDHEPEVSIKESIDHLQETFMDQIHKLNDTIQSYWNPEVAADTEKQASIKNVESGLKVLENNFESGVESLTNGVRVLAVLKSDIREDPTSTTVKPPANPLFPFFQTFQTSISHSIGNFTSAVQNYFAGQGNNSTATTSGTQSDEAQPSRPTVWQGIQNSIQGILRPGQSQQQGVQNDQPAPSGPFAQAIQSSPFVQSVINFIQPKPQQAATSGTPAPQPNPVPASTASEGSNAVPGAANKPEGDEQQKQKPEQADQPAQAQAGPIQQIIQRNPIVQGITGAVQKIQHTITNPEKPREEPVVEGSEKGGFYGWNGGHGGHGPGGEHNNDVNSSGIVKSADPDVPEQDKEKVQEPAKEAEKEPSEAPVKQD